MYNWLKRKGYAPKYEYAGIYCIKVDNTIVYVGKSRNMLKRVAQHYVGIRLENEKKYRILAELKRKGHCIGFDVLYYAQAHQYKKVSAEIGQKEGEYIRQLQPLLNTQIPTEENWKNWEVQPVDAKKVLSMLLDQ